MEIVALHYVLGKPWGKERHVCVISLCQQQNGCSFHVCLISLCQQQNGLQLAIHFWIVLKVLEWNDFWQCIFQTSLQWVSLELLHIFLMGSELSAVSPEFIAADPAFWDPYYWKTLTVFNSTRNWNQTTNSTSRSSTFSFFGGGWLAGSVPCFQEKAPVVECHKNEVLFSRCMDSKFT